MLYTVQTIIYAHIKTYVKREKIEECTRTGSGASHSQPQTYCRERVGTPIWVPLTVETA